jgi:hypothetical protein
MKMFILNFNNLIKKTIFKVQNKTNTKFQISNFNKYLITIIALLFFYLFYLSIPALYSKTWVQRNIENQLLKEFKINFSISSDISYRILPKPHFLIKDSKIFKEVLDKKISLSNIKNLKVFISQRNLFDKEKLSLKYVKIDNANFSLLRDDFKLLKDSSNNKFSSKKIEIEDSNIFFKDTSDEVITIMKISKAFLSLDTENMLNLFNLKGEVFNIPFTFDFKKEFNSSKKTYFEIIAKSLKLNILDVYSSSEVNEDYGNNITSLSNSKIITNYTIEDNVVTFNSIRSKIKNEKVKYDGKLSINPFDLNLNINIENYQLSKLSKLFNINSILNELIKTELLFNDNISINTSITTTSNENSKIFQNAKINFSIINGKINFNKTRLINKKIGLVELDNSNLSFKKDRLILNTDIMIELKNSDELFSLLQTNKKFRKSIKNISANLDYDFLTNQVEFNNIKIDNNEVSDKLYGIIEGSDNNNFGNWNKSKRLLNEFFKNYEG